MEEDLYFVINCSEDGDIYVLAYKKDELTTALTQEDDLLGAEFFNASEQRGATPMNWSKRLIIKGRVVTPRPVEVVARFTID